MKQIIYSIILILFSSCNFINENKTKESLSYWFDRELIIPKDLQFSIKIKDSLSRNLFLDSKLKIFSYVDTSSCATCRLQLKQWIEFNKLIDKLASKRVNLLKVIHVKNIIDAKFELVKDNYNYPVCIDLNDSLNKLNHFPSDERFHCFLLDENNKVILIGNPVQNPKIKDLYIRTICERLGIDTTNINNTENQENRFSFGRFPFSETKKTQFVLRNDSLAELKIDTIYTSCECTIAKSDKSLISQNDSAIISITFKTDKPEEFSRDVYVKTNLSEKPIVYTVDGVAY
ncbi:MAG: DUF1573 domain-containing protein [Bacteroidales bacterium]|nr:DUF1573 domain-containing protein [Bacteroidales bacterium]